MGDVRLTDLSYLRALMARYGIVTKKKYGQNFLVNPSVPERIAEHGCDARCGVLEIGPGVGTLTYELCKRARKVVALEIDETLLPVLRETLGEFDNVKVILRDVLKTDLVKLCEEEFSGCESVRVCANLPYYITTPVLMYLLENGAPFSSVTVMVQREVADRLTARAGSPEYGAITAAVGYFGRAEKLFSVSPGSFLPPPKVESAVVRIDIHENSPYADCDKELFFRLIGAAFGQRRKTLMNTLRGILSEKEREAVMNELSLLGFPRDVRGERLSTDGFAALARAIAAARKNA
ncbi:MAG: 16S rRNA (adenine(1518)-N(6)/adenine(1519)-N(6))-dimethyltransferase RsmA [Clostridia bacterium]|nr:16S rRNA (adenine(1518)-N(6)/adenine(1519)-N(6))-dimethyltransferase RsmA [Clostridia bacterium]